MTKIDKESNKEQKSKDNKEENIKEPKEKKSKNVLITAKSYDYLINELGLQPSFLLVKMEKSEDRIKSPKSNKFIHINSGTYLKLLNDYTEEELLSRRDGFITSPDSTNLIRVFGKTFNSLLLKANEDPKYSLENLLKQPRLQRGNDITGVKYNIVKVDNEKVEILRNLKTQHEKTKDNEVFVDHVKMSKKNKKDKKIINKKNIDKLILSKEPVVIFTEAIFKQVDEDRELDIDAFYNHAGFFTNGKLSYSFEAKELRVDEDVFEYRSHPKIYGDMTNVETLQTYLNEDNEELLNDIKMDQIDLLSLASLKMTKKQLVKILEEKYNTKDQLFNIVSAHMWFISHARLMHVLPENYKLTISEQLNDNYEKSKEVKILKNKLKEEIKLYYEQILNYINTNL